MAGLLDGLLGGSMDDPRTMATLQLAQGLLGGQGGGMQRLAGGMQGYGGVMAQARAQEEEKRRRALQEQMLMQQLESAKAQAAERAAAQATQQKDDGLMRRLLGQPVESDMPQGMQGPGAPMQNRGIDPRTFINQGGSMGGLGQAMQLSQALAPPPRKLTAYKPGDQVRDETGAVAFSVPDKPDKGPTAVQEYEYAVNQGFKGTLQDFMLQQRKAGATNIGMPRIEVKMGDSVAGQIGPMAKDSRTQAQGAVGMFDSADRIQKALDSGKVSAGPLTTQINTVKQLVQKVGGGNDEGIRQTRQVIKGLAQMSVEARKELAGQGQVTESEAAAVAKAESGDINDLTTGELQDLVTLTKRAAHMRAKSHQNLIDSMGANEGTRGTVPFYQVRGLDRLLQHSPGLPQIGGKDAAASFDDAEKERRYQAWKQQQGRP